MARRKKAPTKKQASRAPRRSPPDSRRAARPFRSAGPSHPTHRGVPILTALLRFNQTSALVRAWAPARRYSASPGTLHAPAIQDMTWTGFPAGAGEIVASFHDRRGAYLTGQAWWGRADFFGERYDHGRRQHAGCQVPPRFDDRVFHAQVPAGAVYLVFHRIRVEAGPAPSSLGRVARKISGKGPWGTTHLSYRVLGVYLLPDVINPPDPPPSTFPLPFLLSVLGVWRKIVGYLEFPGPGWPKPGIKRSGWMSSWETVYDGHSRDGRFHIIILGDGYGETELTAFDAKAKELADGILDTEPFKKMKQYLRIDILRCVSYDSGITRCSGTEECGEAYTDFSTYFETEGCWVNPSDPECLGSSPTYLGIEHPEWVYGAAEGIAPYEEVGLYIILANVDVYGGSAFRSQKLAFVPAYSATDTFIELGVHESAHVLADLSEEYTSPLPWDGSTPRNVVEESSKAGAWWASLAQGNELNNAGALKHVYTCPDESTLEPCNATYNDPYLSNADDPKVLGLFWGAQFIDAEEDPCAIDLGTWDSYRDVRGNHFYRPMARCRMRMLFVDFCRACSTEIEKAILAGLVP